MTSDSIKLLQQEKLEDSREDLSSWDFPAYSSLLKGHARKARRRRMMPSSSLSHSAGVHKVSKNKPKEGACSNASSRLLMLVCSLGQ